MVLWYLGVKFEVKIPILGNDTLFSSTFPLIKVLD